MDAGPELSSVGELQRRGGACTLEAEGRPYTASLPPGGGELGKWGARHFSVVVGITGDVALAADKPAFLFYSGVLTLGESF